MKACRASAVHLTRGAFWLAALFGFLASVSAANAQSISAYSVANLTAAKSALMDQEYSKPGGLSLKLDVFLPETVKPSNPAVIIIHGTGVSKGRTGVHFYAEDLAKSGFVAIAASFRHESVYAFPAAIDDIKAALKWVQANSQKYNIDKDRIGMVGFSGGGSLAMIVAAEKPSGVKAVVSYFAPSDLALLHRNANKGNLLFCEDMFVKSMLEKWLGGTPAQQPEKYRAASPISHVHKDSPPSLLIQGMADGLVPLEQCDVMAKRLKQVKAKFEMFTIEDGKHNLDEGKDFKAEAAYLITARFLHRNMPERPAVVLVSRQKN